MRLNASYTVENSVIIPLFAMIVISIASLNCMLHDKVIKQNILIQASIEAQISGISVDSVFELQERVKRYMSDKCIFTTNEDVNLSKTLTDKQTPSKTIWMTRALKEVIRN